MTLFLSALLIASSFAIDYAHGVWFPKSVDEAIEARHPTPTGFSRLVGPSELRPNLHALAGDREAGVALISPVSARFFPPVPRDTGGPLHKNERRVDER